MTLTLKNLKFLNKNEQFIGNTSGDAFAGAFLAEFVQGKPIHICIKCGNFCCL